MRKKALTLLPVLSLMLLAGCAERTTTIQIQSVSEEQYTQEQKVQDSARAMYRMILRQDAQGFCRFVAPASIAKLAAQFSHSDMPPKQICRLITRAAFRAYLQKPQGRQALQASITTAGNTPVVIKGHKAWFGSGQHHTQFQKVRGRWRPWMPKFGDSMSPDNPPDPGQWKEQTQIAV